MNELVEAIIKDMNKFGADALSYKYFFEREDKKYTFTIELNEGYKEESDGEDADFDSKEEKHRLDQIKEIVNNWNNDASHSFENMCKINGILKERD